jgi:lysophospholipase L1-like esterase
LVNGTNFDKSADIDLFIAQLSTNDTRGETAASFPAVLGGIKGPGLSSGDYDRKTINGSIEFIIQYVKETWDCPVLFFSCPQYEDSLYGDMVEGLKDVVNAWADDEVYLLDLWNDEAFNAQLAGHEDLWIMPDKMHPYKAGYMEWWTPKFQEKLYEII